MANRRLGPISNRKHMARQERERLQKRNVTIAAAVVVALVIILVIYGIVVSIFIEPNQPVASVNDQEITTREFRSRVSYQRLLLVSRWNRLADLMISYGGADQNSAAFFVNQLNQIEFQLDPTTVGREVLNELIADRLIREEAAARGIVVTEEEVQQALEEFFGYFGGEQAPTPTSRPTPIPTSTLTPLQMTLTAPTPAPTLTITETQTLTDTGVLTPTQVITPEVSATPVITITSTPQPTPTPFTLDAFQSDYGGYLETIDRLGVTEADLRYLIESQLYRERLQEAMTADLLPFQDQVWARHILVATEQEALDVLARLDAGEDFAALAPELSLDTGSSVNGGDLGWFTLGDMVPEFEKIAFNLDIGEISEPVQSQFGFHIIQLLGHEERALNTDEFEDYKRATFDEWLSKQRLQSDVVLFDIWADRVPTDPSIPPGGAQALLQQLQAPQP